jgi:hypothetical protein
MATSIRIHRYKGKHMIIRATVLVFALMLYMMITAGGHTTRAAPSPDGDDSSPAREHAAPLRERPTEAQTAASTERAASESTEQHPAPDNVRISAYNLLEVMVRSALTPEGKIDFALLDETVLQGLTYAAAEKAISEQLTGKSAAHGPQMKVRQALILGCGLMMREARSMEVESTGKYEKLDLHRPLAHSSLPISVPHVAERTY